MLRAIGNEQIICPYCHLGHMKMRTVVYIRQFGETLIHIPNTPAWECDVCHFRQFDPASVQHIEMLVGQAGPPPNRYRPAPDHKTMGTTRAAKPTKGTKTDSKAKG